MCINGPKKVSDSRLVQISMKRSECGENIEKIKIRKNTVILVENGNQKMWKWISGNMKCTLECDHGRRTMVQT